MTWRAIMAITHFTVQNMRSLFRSLPQKFAWRLDPHYRRRRCSPVTRNVDIRWSSLQKMCQTKALKIAQLSHPVYKLTSFECLIYVPSVNWNRCRPNNCALHFIIIHFAVIWKLINFQGWTLCHENIGLSFHQNAPNSLNEPTMCVTTLD